MSELQVIYDPQLELAAIVDVENRVGWGPAMIGPQAGEMLQLFLDTVPFDMSQLDSYSARSAYESFLERMAGAPPVEADASPAAPVVDNGASGMADYTSADTEASNTPSEPPPPGPVDTDMEADAGTTPTLVVCPNCNGEGEIRYGTEDEPQPCGMCHGTKRITVDLPA